MSQIVAEVLSADAAYAACMDARLAPAEFAGLSEGDAQVIRNSSKQS